MLPSNKFIYENKKGTYNIPKIVIPISDNNIFLLNKNIINEIINENNKTNKISI